MSKMSKMSEFNIEEYLDSLPVNTRKINVSFRNLSYLPDLSRFIFLEKLYCSYNKLTSLSDLPESLTMFHCDNNKLTSLPKLPEKLTRLYCDNNQLTSLPNLPKSLLSLFCNFNDLISLPKLPETLQSL